ncbi:MAG: ABC-F family ATP-binding cassette domain-containing protein [Acidimicrobiia bacterium]|nr:ABC-F family ATP-binding cassette domain-containing protein [Acidimicrobiia bacterium]
MLIARDLAVEVGGRVTLEGASFDVRAGDKVALVGRNGAGKTSLLRVLGGEARPLAGSVTCQGRLGWLPQEPRRDDDAQAGRALDYVLAGRGLDDAVVRLEKLRLAVEEDPSHANVARFSKAEDAFAVAGGYAAESEVRRLVAGLGLAAGRLDLPLAVLSGGERRRVELARILFGGTDVLLLDEPTNHLDNDAKAWLMGFLASYRGALLVVSHDVALLDKALTRVLHLDEGQLVQYRGTYTQYRTARALEEARRARLAERQHAEIRRLHSLADAMRGQTAKRAKTAHALESRARRLQAEAVGPVAKEKRHNVRFPTPPHSGRVTLEVEGLAKTYGDNEVFDDLGFAIERGERLMVLGLNGAGKTSLLRILAGQTDADRGEVRFGVNVSAGYYAQEHEGIRPGTPVLEHMWDSAASKARRRPSGLSVAEGDTTSGRRPMVERSPASTQQLRTLLGMFGLHGDIAFQDAGTLSGGEKTKLALAQLVAGGHNLLLLDEPTNNLDPPSRQAVGQALSGWPGSMVLVSHDPGFVQELQPDRVLLMPDGDVDWWSDDLLDLVALA